ncbi:tRNA (adenosine(37)-N6)-dimethylallyltransferase MiaA [Candidatus Peregrinibacteria bacterium HGW-Peregrinibacteria-1]|jgi:tRNA dimethylallyltransferase|nr:MAG: tRNA (adenosine(37)-N6)-dimethylallyltransferase MiaA [Candidatus Peregrinibacteria bacterium HGW-Peregrinibacteria-1]
MNQFLTKITEFIQSDTKKTKVITILGPTASGKTALSIKVAKLFNGEIISTDSRQIYRQMPIATAVVTVEERQEIPHHLIEILEPDQILTLAEYHQLATQKIEEITSRGKIPILTGGTGLYISAILENYQIPLIPPDDSLRATLQQEKSEKGSEHLHKLLQELDPEAAEHIHPNNARYLIRAIEKSKTSHQKPQKGNSPYESFNIIIDWPREQLYQRIEDRVEQLFQNGIVEEIQALVSKAISPELPSMSAVGVKEIIPFLEGKSTLEETKNLIKRNTRRYAKRQLTWFRRFQDLNYLTPDQLKELLK